MALIIKEPKHPVTFPPANHLRAYQVRDGDNWWTLQKQFGLRDPWSLIKYNFRTDDPAEVNWYLQEYVGCKLKTADGKNYRFSSMAKPGLLYLPRHNFKHGVGGGGFGTGTCDDEPEQQPRKDKAAQGIVLDALNVSAISSIQFEYEGFQVWPDDYHRVRRLIREGEIVVAHNSSLKRNAAYSPGTDAIYLGDREDTSLQATSLIVHEATHAAFDARAQKISDVASEMIAYVAQMMYVLKRDNTTKPPLWDLPEDQTIFAPAWRIAKRILAKRMKHPDPGFSMSMEADYQSMRDGLMAHSTYKKQFECSDTYYSGEAGYNGVKGWVYHWVE